MRLPKPSKIRSKKITQFAKGCHCTVREPGVCNHDNSTVVACHLPGNKGTGSKNHDLMVVFACSSCHAWLDNVHTKKITKEDGWGVLKAFQETLLLIYDEGILNVK